MVARAPQQLAAQPVQLRHVVALEPALGGDEAFLHRNQALVRAVRLEQRLGQVRQEGWPQQSRVHPLLYREAVSQLGDAFLDPTQIGKRQRLEAAAPLDLLRQPVLAADRDHLVAQEHRFRGFAAEQVDVLGERDGEDDADRVLERAPG